MTLCAHRPLASRGSAPLGVASGKRGRLPQCGDDPPHPHGARPPRRVKKPARVPQCGAHVRPPQTSRGTPRRFPPRGGRGCALPAVHARALIAVPRSQRRAHTPRRITPLVPSGPRSRGGPGRAFQLGEAGEGRAGLVGGFGELAERAVAVLDGGEERRRGARRAQDARRGAAPASAKTRPVAPARSSRASAASRMSGAPVWISAWVPPERRRGDLARDGADRAAELGGEVRGGQRARALRRLDDDGRGRERGDDPVAGDEAPAVRARARRHLGDDRAALGDRGVQAVPAGRVRRCARSPRARRSSAPDASSAPACAAESMPIARPETTVISRGRQAAAHRPRDVEPVRRGPPGADDADAFRVREHARVTEDVQHGRRVREVAQPLRVLVLAAARRS